MPVETIKPYRDADGRIVAVSNFNPKHTGQKVTVVAGPPAAGKTTYVDAHKKPGDIVLDLDVLAVALGSSTSHGHSPEHYAAAYAAFDGVIDRLPKLKTSKHVWIIATMATKEQRHSIPGARVIVLETPEAVAIHRAKTAGRPDNWPQIITNWWQTYERAVTDTVITGE